MVVMSKTIVMIGNTSWGMLRFRGDLAQKFSAEGHNVIIVAPEDEYSHQFSKFGAKFVPVSVNRKGTNPFADLAYMIKLLRVLLEIRPDIVLCYTIKPILYGILAGKLSGVPVRMAITTGLGNVFGSEGWVNRLVKLLYKFTLKFASEVWFLNEADAEIFLNNHLVKQDKIFILPGEGVDVDHFSPQKIPSREMFTLIGRMLWDKGVGIFVESARLLKKDNPEIHFRLVGPVDLANPEGISHEKLEEWSREGVVEYFGATDNIRGILGETTCLVHPTYYKEGLPRVLMEASSMEIPCITTDIPGCRDVVKHGENGFLIPVRNVSALYNEMTRFVSLGKVERKILSEAGRKLILQKFSSEHIHEIYFKRLAL
jgi:glycosyltransferase involved in cell wall biosynthesis